MNAEVSAASISARAAQLAGKQAARRELGQFQPATLAVPKRDRKVEDVRRGEHRIPIENARATAFEPFAFFRGNAGRRGGLSLNVNVRGRHEDSLAVQSQLLASRCRRLYGNAHSTKLSEAMGAPIAAGPRSQQGVLMCSEASSERMKSRIHLLDFRSESFWGRNMRGTR